MGQELAAARAGPLVEQREGRQAAKWKKSKLKRFTPANVSCQPQKAGAPPLGGITGGSQRTQLSPPELWVEGCWVWGHAHGAVPLRGLFSSIRNTF